MSGYELILTALNVFQACFIAWISLQQARVKHELERVNGAVDEQLLEIRRRLADDRGPSEAS